MFTLIETFTNDSVYLDLFKNENRWFLKCDFHCFILFFYDISCEKKVLDLCCLARLDLLCMRRDVDKFIIEKVTFFRESSKFPKFQIFFDLPLNNEIYTLNMLKGIYITVIK